ncbi:MAG: IS481 family transposase, partial [Candidatus Marinimicrobia bacterium]|nr:IS481 family transposase [Candidatus Neomarinimicrobiota bacterium]
MEHSERKLAQKRLSALELAKALGNVSEACRQRGISRSRFYEYKKRFKTHGMEGLIDLPPIHKTHPQTTPPAVVKRILDLAVHNPMWGCHRLSDQLKLTGVSVSGITIQKILDKNAMSSQYDRLLKLEELASGHQIELTAEQVRAIGKANPCYKERHIESSRPGELLSQDTFYVGHLKGTGKVYLQAVIDTYCSYAFGYLHTGKIPEHSVSVVYNDVVPQYQSWNLTLKAILTDNGREYCGTSNHPYEMFLELADIEHRKTKVRHPQTNGFVERFNRTVLDEF